MVKKFELGWQAEVRVSKPVQLPPIERAWKRLAECCCGDISVGKL